MDPEIRKIYAIGIYETGSENSCTKTKDCKLQILLPLGPVEWIIGVF